MEDRSERTPDLVSSPTVGRTSTAPPGPPTSSNGNRAGAVLSMLSLTEATPAITPQPNGQPPPGRVTRRIAICGTAPSTRTQIPWNEKDFEFWALNDAHKLFPIQEGTVNGHPRMIWFETHPREWFTGTNRPADHLAWLQKCPVPIYMWQHYDDIPNSIAFPLEQLRQMFPGATKRWELVTGPNGQVVPKLVKQEGYFTSTIAYMVAMAIAELQAGDELWFWGVDLAAPTEYFRQRPCLEYMLGYAQAKGIKVALPAACPILKGPFYGSVDPTDQIADAVRQKLEMKWQKAVTEKRQAEGRLVFLQGKTQAYEEMKAEFPEG